MRRRVFQRLSARHHTSVRKGRESKARQWRSKPWRPGPAAWRAFLCMRSYPLGQYQYRVAAGTNRKPRLL